MTSTHVMTLTIALAAVAAGINGLLHDDWTQKRSTIAEGRQSETDVTSRLSASPLHTALWIDLSRLRADNAGHDAALEMAFLTGARDAADVFARLRRAVRSSAFFDPAINEFVKADIQNIILLKPEMRSSLLSIEQEAALANKEAFRNLIKGIDKGVTNARQ